VGTQYVKFLLAAGASVPINLASRVLFSNVAPFGVAIVLSQIVGLLVAYGLTRTFVFQSTRTSWIGELARFAVVNLFSLAQMWIVSMVTLYAILPKLGNPSFKELTAHAIGLASTSFTAFFGHKLYSFGEKASEASRLRRMRP
jgi:putative flippase GtrA